MLLPLEQHGLAAVAFVCFAAAALALYVRARAPTVRFVAAAQLKKIAGSRASAEIIDARKAVWFKPNEKVIIHGLGAGDCELYLNVLDAPIEATALQTLQGSIPWCEMAHRGGVVPRLVAVQADADETGRIPLYRHPADAQPKTWPFHELVRTLAHCAERAVALRGQYGLLHFNHCLLQWYRSGADYISEHSDKTLDIRRDSPIVNVSLGATRVLTLRAKRARGEPRSNQPGHRPPRASQKIALPHNSMFILGSVTNKEFTHMISRDGRRIAEKSVDEMRDEGNRISLTFRDVATFEHNGVIEGQGGPRSPRPPASPGTPEYEREFALMIAAFSAENRERDFDWDLHYGRGFALRGFDVIQP